MSESSEREVTLFTAQAKIKGKVRVVSGDAGLPMTAVDPFLEVTEASVFDEAGTRTIARLKRVRVRRSSVTLYFFEDDLLGKGR